MSMSASRKYDPRSFKALTFHDAAARFREGADSPRASVVHSCPWSHSPHSLSATAFAG